MVGGWMQKPNSGWRRRIVGGRGMWWAAGCTWCTFELNGGGRWQVVDAEAEEWWSVEANGGWRGQVVGGGCEWWAADASGELQR